MLHRNFYTGSTLGLRRRLCRRGFIFLALVGALATVHVGTASQALAQADATNILVIGTSFSNGMGAQLEKIIKNTLGLSSDEINVKSNARNGTWLYEHLAGAGTAINSIQGIGSGAVSRAAATGGWDYIVLQETRNGMYEYAIDPNGGQPEGSYATLCQFLEFIEANAIGDPVVMLGQTWHNPAQPYSAIAPALFSSFQNVSNPLLCSTVQSPTYDQVCVAAGACEVGAPMGRCYCTGYVPIAHEVGVPISPTGRTFKIIDDEDPIAWAALHGSGGHPSGRGTYLYALTTFFAMYGLPPDGYPNPVWIKSGWESERDQYHTAAWDAVSDDSQLWNNPIPREVEVQIGASADDGHRSYLQAAVFDYPIFGLAPLQNVGLRFQNVQIPVGAEVIEARIEGVVFTGGQSQYPITVRSEVLLWHTQPLFALWWHYSKQPNGEGYNESVFTTAWTPLALETIADVTSGVASLVARPEWFDGDSITVSIGTLIPDAPSVVPNPGSRTILTWDHNPTTAPRLVVRYKDPIL